MNQCFPSTLESQSAGRLLYAYLGFICDEQHFDKSATFGGFPPLVPTAPPSPRCAVGQQPVLKIEQLLKEMLRGALLCPRLRGGKGTGFVGSPWATENPVTRFPLGEVPRSGQGGALFPRAKPGCKGFIHTGAPFFLKGRPPEPSAAKPLSNLSTLRTFGPQEPVTPHVTPKGRVKSTPLSLLYTFHP